MANGLNYGAASAGNETEFFHKNATQYCYVGLGKDFPECASNVHEGVSILPGRMWRSTSHAFRYHLMNHPHTLISFRGPKTEVEAELAALVKRGATDVKVLSEKDGIIEGTLKGLGAAVEDATAEFRAASSGLMNDPNLVVHAGTLQKRNEALEAENVKLRAELEALKKKAGQRLANTLQKE